MIRDCSDSLIYFENYAQRFIPFLWNCKGNLIHSWTMTKSANWFSNIFWYYDFLESIEAIDIVFRLESFIKGEIINLSDSVFVIVSYPHLIRSIKMRLLSWLTHYSFPDNLRNFDSFHLSWWIRCDWIHYPSLKMSQMLIH